jgi:hypothetical protein
MRKVPFTTRPNVPHPSATSNGVILDFATSDQARDG